MHVSLVTQLGKKQAEDTAVRPIPPLDGASVTFPLYQNSHVYTAAVHSSPPAGGDRDIRSQELENASVLK